MVIELETGKPITETQLQKYINVANQEVREQEIEVHEHMDFMVRIGLYEEFVKDLKIVNHVEKINYIMLLEERQKKDSGNKNLIVSLSNNIVRISAHKGTMVTNIAFLAKTKHMLEEEEEKKKKSGKTTAEIIINNDELPLNEAPNNQDENLEELIDTATNRININEDRIA